MSRWIILVIALSIVALFGAGTFARAQSTVEETLLDKIANRIGDNLSDRFFGQDVFGGLGGIKTSPFTLTTRDSGGGPSTTTEQFGSILPAENNNFNLGTYARSWRDLYVSGTAYIAGLSLAAGTSTFTNIEVTGNTRLGDATSDLIDVTGRISTTVNPNVNNSLDLGAYGLAWRSIYASGTLFANALTIAGTGTSTHAGNLTVNGNTRLGDATSDLIDLTGQVSTSIIPNTNNTLDLGAYSNAWRSIYTSSTIIANAVTSSFVDVVGNALVGSFRTNPGNMTISMSAGDILFNAPGVIIFQDTSVTMLQLSVPAAGRTQFLIAGGTYMQFGDATVTSQGLNDNDDIMVARHLEVNGTLFMDGGASSSLHINPTTNNAYDLGGFGTAWRNIYSSSSLNVGSGAASSTISSSGNIDVTGNYLRSGRAVTASTTLNFTFSQAPATGTTISALDYLRVPFNCTIGEVNLSATSTVGTSFRTIVDINTHTEPGLATTTIFTDQGLRADLGANQKTSTTIPSVTALTRGQFLSVDLDQYDSHRGLLLQIVCAHAVR